MSRLSSLHLLTFVVRGNVVFGSQYQATYLGQVILRVGIVPFLRSRARPKCVFVELQAFVGCTFEDHGSHAAIADRKRVVGVIPASQIV